MVRLNNFKQFNESESDDFGLISKDELKDIFADILDEGYQIKFHSHAESYSFFEIEKSLSNELLGAISKGSSSGFTNIDNIAKEFSVISMLEGIKNMLNSMGYTIGFEFESNLTMTSDRTIKIICHLELNIEWSKEKELTEDEIDELDDEEYEEYMRGQGYNI